MSQLQDELKRIIVQALMLEDTVPSDIEADAPLFGEGLGLDSVDALELAMEVEKRFGVKLGSDEAGRAALTSVQTLAEFIEERRS